MDGSRDTPAGAFIDTVADIAAAIAMMFFIVGAGLFLSGLA